MIVLGCPAHERWQAVQEIAVVEGCGRLTRFPPFTFGSNQFPDGLEGTVNVTVAGDDPEHTEVFSVAEQLTEVPGRLELPTQLHSKVPDPELVTVPGVPTWQRLDVGALEKVCPLADPHTPVTASVAVQDAFEPPLLPRQNQLNGPLPLTAEGEPWLQRPKLGEDPTTELLAGPQAPFTATGAGFCVGVGFPEEDGLRVGVGFPEDVGLWDEVGLD